MVTISSRLKFVDSQNVEKLQTIQNRECDQ